jgi:hypothetical protein
LGQLDGVLIREKQTTIYWRLINAMEAKKNEPRFRTNTNTTRGEYKDRRATRSSSEPASWNAVQPTTIAALVQAATACGGCAILGITSDGGALSITVIVGNDRVREYPRDNQGVLDFTQWLAEEYA